MRASLSWASLTCALTFTKTHWQPTLAMADHNHPPGPAAAVLRSNPLQPAERAAAATQNSLQLAILVPGRGVRERTTDEMSQFRLFDKDKKGWISSEEFVKGCASFNLYPSAEVWQHSRQKVGVDLAGFLQPHQCCTNWYKIQISKRLVYVRPKFWLTLSIHGLAAHLVNSL
jgi:hypothetical protein